MGPIMGPTANPWSLGKRGPEERGVRGADATPRPRLLGPQSALCAPRTRPLPRAAWRRPPGLARAGADRPPPALWLEARSRSLQPARETRSRPARLGPAAVPYLPRLCSQPARPACLRRLPARRRGAPARWAASHEPGLARSSARPFCLAPPPDGARPFGLAPPRRPARAPSGSSPGPCPPGPAPLPGPTLTQRHLPTPGRSTARLHSPPRDLGLASAGSQGPPHRLLLPSGGLRAQLAGLGVRGWVQGGWSGPQSPGNPHLSPLLVPRREGCRVGCGCGRHPRTSHNRCAVNARVCPAQGPLMAPLWTALPPPPNPLILILQEKERSTQVRRPGAGPPS